MTTTFTINSHHVFNVHEVLDSIGAVSVGIHEAQPSSFKECYCGGTCNWSPGLPAGTTFRVEGVFSRSSLARLLGSDAMVRGVRTV